MDWIFPNRCPDRLTTDNNVSRQSDVYGNQFHESFFASSEDKFPCEDDSHASSALESPARLELRLRELTGQIAFPSISLGPVGSILRGTPSSFRIERQIE